MAQENRAISSPQTALVSTQGRDLPTPATEPLPPVETPPETALETVSCPISASEQTDPAISTPRLRRLPRFTRAKRSHRPPIALQDRDLELLRTVFAYRIISVVAASEPLGTLESFVASYGDGKRLDALRTRVAPYLLRRTKDECLDLPAKTFVDMQVELPAWQRRLYDSMRDEFVCEVQGMSGEEFRAYAPTALAKLLRLSQIASNPALLLPTEPRVPAKFEELDHLLEEIIRGGNDKVIIWSHYVGTLEALIERYREFSPVALYGGTPAADRQAIARRFQEDKDVRLLVGNPAAGGSGFTLTTARYAIYETLSWRYDFYAQSQDRIHRIGQERPVTYIRLLAANTIEEVIAEALERKAELARALLGDAGGRAAITALSVEAFCQMITTNRLPSGA
jgi:hypothetical protein